MEFVLLPLLLLAGLLTALDGGNDGDGNGDGDASGDDTLEGSGSQSVTGGAGDDLLSLMDEAVGFGGTSDDTIVMSGENDGSVTASGGDGQDLFVMTDLVDTMQEAASSTGSTMTIRDFDPQEDVLGVVFDPELLDSLQISSSYDSETGASTVSITQHYSGGEPPLLTVAEFVLEGVQEFDPTTLQFYADGSLEPLVFEVDGTEGNDVLGHGHPSGELTAMGYGGDDQITAGSGGAFGGAGDDNLRDGLGWIGGGDLYGEAGDDTLAGSGNLNGGVGNDVISLGTERVSYGSGWPRYVLDGQAVGGEGDDTITAGAPEGEPQHGIGTTISSGVHIDAGAGDDLIRFKDGLTVDAGSGNDIIIKGTGYATSTGDDPTVTLGDGADRFFLKPELDADWVDARLSDFDPAEDALGIIAPETLMANVTMDVSYDAALNRTTITFDNRGSDAFDGYQAAYVLDGVNGVANPIAIQLFADDAAALAGTPYRTL